MQRSWNKYGESNFKFYILEECAASQLDILEIAYIASYDAANYKYGYNLTSGGTHCKLSSSTKKKIGERSKGRKFSEETKRQMSETHKGENNSFYGKHHTEEAKKKMKENHYDTSGENNPRFNPEPVICINTSKLYSSAYAAAKELGLYSSGIRKCCQGKLKTTGGLQFKFA